MKMHVRVNEFVYHYGDCSKSNGDFLSNGTADITNDILTQFNFMESIPG